MQIKWINALQIKIYSPTLTLRAPLSFILPQPLHLLEAQWLLFRRCFPLEAVFCPVTWKGTKAFQNYSEASTQISVPDLHHHPKPAV